MEADYPENGGLIPRLITANWRIRGYGPPFEPKFLGLGNKVFYRPDRLAAWLSNGNIEPWEVNLQWLARRDILVNPANRDAVEWIIAALELQLNGAPWPPSETIKEGENSNE